MIVPKVEEAAAKKRKDRTALDEFVCLYVGTNRKLRNALQKVVDYVEIMRSN